LTARTAIPANMTAGQPASLGNYAGKALLVVDVASKCGLTPQYEGPEKSQAEFGANGFSVPGVPANDFGGQERGSTEELAELRSTRFSVSFPLHERIVVPGADKHPLRAAPNETIAAELAQ